MLQKKMENIGWEAFFSLKENIYPEMIKEYYVNMVFEKSELKATSMTKGHKIELTQQFMLDISHQ